MTKLLKQALDCPPSVPVHTSVFTSQGGADDSHILYGTQVGMSPLSHVIL